ncbi:hypothetical protein B0H11DRAFT_2183183 [Mycena galericulata]|nr:hypothetical protein B0H11DRAFT_2183183 [Mycena galericulata]
MSSLFSTIVAAFRCPLRASLCPLVHSSRIASIKDPTFSGPGPGAYLLVCGLTQPAEEVDSGARCRFSALCSSDPNGFFWPIHHTVNILQSLFNINLLYLIHDAECEQQIMLSNIPKRRWWAEPAARSSERAFRVGTAREAGPGDHAGQIR